MSGSACWFFLFYILISVCLSGVELKSITGLYIPLCGTNLDNGEWFVELGDHIKVYTNDHDDEPSCVKRFIARRGHHLVASFDREKTVMDTCNMEITVYDGNSYRSNQMMRLNCQDIVSAKPVTSDSNFITVETARAGPPHHGRHNVIIDIYAVEKHVETDERESGLSDGALIGLTIAVTCAVLAVLTLIAVGVLWYRGRKPTRRNGQGSTSSTGEDEEEEMTGKTSQPLVSMGGSTSKLSSQ